jgi:hypothetical protein
MEICCPTPGTPTLKYSPVSSNESLQTGGYKDKQVPLNTLGFWKLTKSCLFYCSPKVETNYKELKSAKSSK